MKPPIVDSPEPVTLIGGGVLGAADLGTVLPFAPRLVAADGGADAALAAGRRPEAVIGDMDSISEGARAELAEALHEISEQETTDFDKALRSIRAPLVLAVGLSGGRFDHDLAALNVLVRLAHLRCVVVGPESLVFLAPPELSLDLAPGTVVSLFPMGRVAGTSEGLRWPIEGLDFTPWGRIGTSNTATGPVRMTFDAPLMLVILPRRTLPEVVSSLAAPGAGGWPGAG
ncbi:thiamine diphosphokinase [Histidinibacterium aquaticum]|uniref:Thiamine diphosphokinase n=1 Tax=Histidinibacterium aquaticum TaxID=2613962 RepID=A0A5J5GIF2_9RHOB|nr:thiamine diphosphokinase [Histidinibacterium aquaticum]KAA9007935.1 thiamine diphosphokinase [Histidinibacterium aquaticum]